MSPKKVVVVASVNVYREQDRLSYEIPVTASTTIGELKAMLTTRFGIAADVEVKVRHHGHRMTDGDKVGSKSPLCLQEISVVKSINDSMTILDLSKWTSPELLTWAIANAVVVNKSAGKAVLVAAIMAFKNVTDPSSVLTEEIEIQIETPRGSIIPKLVRAGDIIKLADFDTQAADDKSTTWWSSEQEAEGEALIARNEKLEARVQKLKGHNKNLQLRIMELEQEAEQEAEQEPIKEPIKESRYSPTTDEMQSEPSPKQPDFVINIMPAETLEIDGKYQIFVKVENETLVLEVKASDTILSLKGQIQTNKGIPPDQLRLTYAGKLLNNASTLRDNGISAEASLDSSPNMLGGMDFPASIFVQSDSGSEDQSELTATVKPMKEIATASSSFERVFAKKQINKQIQQHKHNLTRLTRFSCAGRSWSSTQRSGERTLRRPTRRSSQLRP